MDTALQDASAPSPAASRVLEASDSLNEDERHEETVAILRRAALSETDTVPEGLREDIERRKAEYLGDPSQAVPRVEARAQLLRTRRS